MKSYKCFLFFLMACMDVNGRSDSILKKIVINAGEDYTFKCRFPNSLTEVFWYLTANVKSQSSEFISRLQPTIGDVPIYYYTDFVGPSVACQHIVSTSSDYDIFSLTVFNMTISNSAVYACSGTDFIRRYVTKVVDCPCVVTTEPLLDHGTARKRKNVTCTLETYSTPNFAPAQTTIRRPNNIKKQISGSIAGNNVTFSTNNALKKDLTITLNPFHNFEGNITCIVPALETQAPTTQRIITTLTEKNNSPQSTNYISPLGKPFLNTSKEAERQKNASGGAIVIVTSVVASSVILMLVIAMVALRFRRKRERARSGSTPGRHETREEQVEVKETSMCYTSIQDTAPPGHAGEIEYTEKGGKGEFDHSFSSEGMVDNHLYDFNMDGSRRELTTDPSTVDAGGSLYTMLDRASKSGSASYRYLREAQKEVMHPSLSARGRSDDVTPPQESQEGQKHNDDALDDTEDASTGDLYAIPDKGPGSRNGVAHYSPGTPGDNHDKGHDVRALFTVVDRSSKVAKEEPLDVSDLYAVVDKRNNNK